MDTLYWLIRLNEINTINFNWFQQIFVTFSFFRSIVLVIRADYFSMPEVSNIMSLCIWKGLISSHQKCFLLNKFKGKYYFRLQHLLMIFIIILILSLMQKMTITISWLRFLLSKVIAIFTPPWSASKCFSVHYQAQASVISLNTGWKYLSTFGLDVCEHEWVWGIKCSC